MGGLDVDGNDEDVLQIALRGNGFPELCFRRSLFDFPACIWKEVDSMKQRGNFRSAFLISIRRVLRVLEGKAG